MHVIAYETMVSFVDAVINDTMTTIVCVCAAELFQHYVNNQGNESKVKSVGNRVINNYLNCMTCTSIHAVVMHVVTAIKTACT